MDDDLDGMTRDELASEVRKLRGGIRDHRDSTGHELCWHHPALWSLLPEKSDPLPAVPDWPDFLRGCVRYRQSLDEQVPDRAGPRGAIVLPPSGGRRYAMGAIEAVFKADEGETLARYSVSEWWLEPETEGPGAHSHEENDEVFYVLEGAPALRIGEKWIDAPQGSFVMIPAGTVHDFRNPTDRRAGLLNVFIPGGFERRMPAIAEWFRTNR